MRLKFSTRNEPKKKSYPSWKKRKNIPLPINSYKVVKDIAKTRKLTMTEAFVLLIGHGAQHLADQEAANAADTARMQRLKTIIDDNLKNIIEKASEETQK